MVSEAQAQKILAEFLSDKKNFHLLAGDASTRQYYRYQTKDHDKSYILTYYPGESSLASLKRYNYWQKKYHDHSILVPKIYAVDFKHQLVLQEDIGNEPLQAQLGIGSQDLAKNSLNDAVSKLSMIRKLRIEDYQKLLSTEVPSFNLAKLQFEINHTLKYFVGHFLEKQHEVEKLQKLWLPLLEKLSKLPMHLSHRDYHSRNLMHFKNQLYVIDFQDSMLGPIQYDLCSLLDDCYIKYHPAVYQSVMRNFFDQVVQDKHHNESYEEFFVNYHLVKLQRQYKAIGSFCYVWSDKNNVRYLKYISYVMESLKSSFEVLNLPELAALKEKVLTLYYEH
jgi:aminoglycoside/choline kinase family phosphotransferase